MSNRINKGLTWMNENQIIRRCQRHDLKAYKMIYDRYEQPLLHTAQRMLRQTQDAEDAVQMTFLKLYRGIKNYRFGSKFSSYLFKILMNVCFDMARKKGKAKVVSIDDYTPSSKQEFDLKIQLENSIDALPEKMRVCFLLYAVEQFKLKEIAQILDISTGGVKSNIYHAKMKLRGMLNPTSEEI